MYGVFTMSALLYLVAIIYGIFYLKEPSYEPELKIEATKKGRIADFFDTKHVFDCFNVVFKKGSNQRRLRVILLIVVWMVILGPMNGITKIDLQFMIMIFINYR